MKVKELSKDANLTKVQIKLTDKLREQYKNYSSKGESDMYLVGQVLGDWFISPDSPSASRRALYPKPLEVSPSDFLECEVI